MRPPLPDRGETLRVHGGRPALHDHRGGAGGVARGDGEAGRLRRETYRQRGGPERHCLHIPGRSRTGGPGRKHGRDGEGMKIYTKQGDEGETSLRFGDRVSKSATRVEAYGAVDEANAAIAMALAHLEEARASDAPGAATLPAMLERVIRELFDLGADLSIPA